MFPLRNGLEQGDALSPLLLNFAVEYAIKKINLFQDILKLNGTYQIVAYADVNILGESLIILKINAVALILATKDIGLEVNGDKTKNMVMSRDQNAGRSHSMKIDNLKLTMR
jgi:hypothetical protein